MKLKKIIAVGVAAAMATAAFGITVSAETNRVGPYTVSYSSNINKLYAVSTSSISADPSAHEISLILNGRYSYRDESNKIHNDSKTVQSSDSGCAVQYSISKVGGEMIYVYADHMFGILPYGGEFYSGSFQSKAVR